jgi:acyl-homoserine lactone acylase PvdQ
VLDFFKDASFGVREDDILRVYSPTAGVTIVRDASHGVPHIFGTTRYATMFGQGYATAEDRLFLMDVLRHVGRARMSEFLGASPGNVHMDQEQIAVAPYLEADLTAQVNALAGAGVEGQAVHDDAQAYIDGVNAYVTETLSDATKLPAEYPALQQLPQPFKVEDIVSIASLVGGIFGKGGGGELRTSAASSACRARSARRPRARCSTTCTSPTSPTRRRRRARTRRTCRISAPSIRPRTPRSTATRSCRSTRMGRRSRTCSTRSRRACPDWVCRGSCRTASC